jgi:alcohol dehydrogenase YqhD (iron-dependent ADH family)
LGRKKDFAAHKLGHELSGRFDAIHAESLTVMWPAWAETVYEDKPARFAQFASRVWGVDSGTDEERARAGIRKAVEFFKGIGMPTDFTGLGIGVQSEECLAQLADMCTDHGQKKVAEFHPLDREMVLQIYQRANH